MRFLIDRRFLAVFLTNHKDVWIPGGRSWSAIGSRPGRPLV